MLPAEVHFNAAGALSGSDARLIWELVANITPAIDVLNRHGLTPADLAAKKRDPMFITAWKEIKQAWNSDLNVKQRIQLKAGLLLEDSLEDLILIVKDPQMAASLKLEAIEKLGKLSQTINPKAIVGAGEGNSFKLTINLGDSPEKKVIIDGHAITSKTENVA